jgi:hypothetical protein
VLVYRAQQGRSSKLTRIDAASALSSASAPLSDTFVSGLIKELVTRMELSQEDVILAASSKPVHGLLSALQQILPLLPTGPATDRLFQAALKAIALSWGCARPILSSADVGEGADEDSVDHEEARAAKIVSAKGEAGGRREREMLLSWAWRTMRESRSVAALDSLPHRC